MQQTPIIELNVHGLTSDEAVEKIALCLKNANASTYRIRIIHGYNRGTRIQKAIYRDFDPYFEPKVKRITGGDNPGITELVLREY